MRGTSRRRRPMAMTLFVCCCLFTVACADNSPEARGGGPGPVFFSWYYNASVGATTPQEAYARSAQFTPCWMADGRITTSPDQSVTWLVSGPGIGVAYLRATCRGALRGDYVYRNLFEVVKGPGSSQNTSGWAPDDQAELRWPFPPTEDIHPTSAPFAPSIADLLPADSYRDSGPGRMSYPAPPSRFHPVFWAWRSWVALTPRDYVLGLVADSDVRPPDATPTTVGGLPGWVTEANGMATVVMPRSATAIFFSGTGSASEIEALAARVLPNAEEALGGPPPPTPTPPPTSTPSMGSGR